LIDYILLRKKDKIQMLIINFLENSKPVVIILFSLIERTGKLIQDKGYSYNRLEWDTKLKVKKSTEKDKGSYPPPLGLGDTCSQPLNYVYKVLGLISFV